MQLSWVICFAAASLAMATPVRQTKLARAGALQRRAAQAQEVTQPQPAPQPEEEEDEVDTNDVITSIASQLSSLIFNEETGDDVETGLSALFEILNRA